MKREELPDEQFERRISKEKSLWDKEFFARHHLGADFRLGDFSSNFASRPEFGPIAALAGDLNGKRVLDCGCGDGHNSIQLALSGADVVAVDVSEEAGLLLKKKAAFNGVSDRIEFRAVPLERLGLPDGEFDFVFGKAVLHHVMVEKALEEALRVLKPGGCYGFIEPMGDNPLINLARKYMVATGKETYGNDVPFKLAALDGLQRKFPGLEYRTFEILAALRFLRKVFPGLFRNSFAGAFWRFLASRRVFLFDDFIMRHFPLTRRLARIVVITGVKR